MTFIIPAGNPVTNPMAAPIGAGADQIPDGANEFTYSEATTGILTIKLKVYVPEVGSMPEDIINRHRFEVDAIGEIVPVWDAANPEGKPTRSGDCLEAVVRFNGLPLHNTAFGPKTAWLLFDGEAVAAQGYEVFFEKWATNHPGEGAGTAQNWFYYWKDGGVCGIDGSCRFDPGGNYPGFCRPGVEPWVYLGPAASWYCDLAGYVVQTEITGETFGPYTINGSGAGIYRVPEIIAHERQHLQRYADFGANPENDPDVDYIPTSSESAYCGMKTHPGFANTFSILTMGTKGDDEARCALIETCHSISVGPSGDWANPGSNSKDKFIRGWSQF